MKLLIDECLHTSLVELAHAAGHVADHVNYLGLGRFERLATHGHHPPAGLYVCNEQSFRLSCSPWQQEPLHAGVIIIVPSVTPARQRELFSAALEHIGARDLTNTVVEVVYEEIGLSVQNMPYQRRVNEIRNEAMDEYP